MLADDDGKENFPADVINKVIEAAPSTEWKLLIALWRFAGLRKMESLDLTWNDVLWSEQKLRVRSSKTKRHKGKEMRYVPTRDDEAYLSDAFAVAGKDKTLLFPCIRGTDLSHNFQSIVENAGYEPWLNPIRNLRLSCENDWLTANEAPAHVIAAWIGHSIAVQNSSYAIVSNGHFDQFNARCSDAKKSGNHSGNKPSRIDTNDHESELPLKLSPSNKTLKPNENTGFQTPKDHFTKKSVGPRVV